MTGSSPYLTKDWIFVLLVPTDAAHQYISIFKNDLERYIGAKILQMNQKQKENRLNVSCCF